jgi:diguanylate cyclase (GGDEF)-like protein
MTQLRFPFTTRILTVSGVSLGIFAVSLLSVVRRTVTRAVYAETDAGVQVAQNVFRHLIQSKGEATVVDGHLQFGDWNPRDDDSLVDRLKALTGADATLFEVIDGTPIRVSTTIGKLDGSGRNTGTELIGPARFAFDRGESYAGTGPVAGHDFLNRYDAITGLDGSRIGIAYTGVPLAKMHAAARDTMRAVMTGTAIALVPSLAALYVITRPVKRTFVRAVAVARGLALGNVDQLTERSFLNDELGDVNAAFAQMIAYQQRMTALADAIAHGDLSNEIVPASSSDRLGIAFGQMTLQLRTQVAQLKLTAQTDMLTQLGNRRAFDLHLEGEISRTARHGGTVSLALIDIDNFKAVNDTHGHQRGDTVLAKFGAILKTARREDAGFRLGGDEFALVLPDTTASDARTIMERIRAKAQAQMFGTTVTIGIASSAEGFMDAGTLTREADTALYNGKQRGRNTVTIFEADMAEAESPPSERRNA